MRVYVAATLRQLAGFVAGDEVVGGDRFVAEDDSEDAEYAALTAAADAAATLLDGSGRRVVVVADVPDPDARFPVSLVAAVHVDTEPVDPRDRDLPDLGWYAGQEVPDLLRDGA
jgi:hypothetical protein